MPELIRADVALVKQGLAASREQAQELIRASLALADGRPIAKCAQKLPESAVLTVTGTVCPYVSRGGFKLEKALDTFGTSCAGLVCVDVGASTGGFTDVLLQRGAARVYAVDVGTGQLVPSIANDPRVVQMDHTNARTLTAAQFSPVPTLAVMDVSFISIRLILPALFELLGPEGRILSLVKPQFEAGPANLGKNGIVTKPAVREQVLRELIPFPELYGWQTEQLTFSPIRGTEGNTEFLIQLAPREKAAAHVTAADIRATVAQAAEAFKKHD